MDARITAFVFIGQGETRGGEARAGARREQWSLQRYHGDSYAASSCPGASRSSVVMTSPGEANTLVPGWPASSLAHACSSSDRARKTGRPWARAKRSCVLAPLV